MEVETIDITPSPIMLLAKQAQHLTWKEAVGELIDNALDAGATVIDIAFGNRSLTVTDNGSGCGNVSAMLTEGIHIAGPGHTPLGRYGVGLKDAATWLWGKLTIESVNRDAKHILVANWDALSKQRQWKLPKPISEERNDRATGVKLAFTHIKRNKPNIAVLSADLGKIFAPALKQQKQIALRQSQNAKPILCRPLELPPFDDLCDEAFEVGGRPVHIHIGIVKTEYANPLSGFLFIYGHRVIKESSFGSCGMSTKRVAGTVELGKGWALARNKNDLVDDNQQVELESAIYNRISAMLEKARQQSLLLKGDVFNSTLNEMFKNALNRLAADAGAQVEEGSVETNGSVKTKKEKRSPTDNAPGAVAPKNTGRKRGAKKTHPGETLAENARSFIERGGRIEWTPFSECTTGRADIPGSVIWLNENNRDLQTLQATGNEQAVLQVALSLFAAELLDDEQRAKFPALREYTTFPQLLAGVLAVVATAASVTTEPSTH